MPRKDNLLRRELQERFPTKSSLMLIALLLAFSLIPRETYGPEPENPNIEYYSLDIVENDILTVYIRPIVEEVSVDCRPLDRGKPFDLSVSTNHTDSLFGRTTAIWMRPGLPGTYNLTISFQSSKAWDYIIGVFARDLDFYTEFYGKNVKFSGTFGEFFTFSRQPGNWSVSIMLISHGQLSPSIFNIELPTPLNAILFVTAAGLVAYFNLFLIFDTYFKNKKETISNKERILVAIVIIISAFAVYQLYLFVASISPWGA